MVLSNVVLWSLFYKPYLVPYLLYRTAFCINKIVKRILKGLLNVGTWDFYHFLKGFEIVMVLLTYHVLPC